MTGSMRGTDRRRELSHLCREGVLPVLRPGDIVVMDNLGSHKAMPCPAHPLRRSQAVLPAKILTRPETDRTGLCQAQAPGPKAAARTVDAVCAAIGHALDAFTPG